MILTEKIQLKKTNYYQIIHKKTQNALYIGSSVSDFKAEKASLVMSNPQSLGQVWLIIEVDKEKKPDLFEIVHARSTFVLQCLRPSMLRKFYEGLQKNQMRLRYGNWENDQLFYLQRPDSSNFPNIFRFSAEKYKNNYIFYDGILKCDQIDPNDELCHWQLRLCHDNPVVNRSCYLENAFSTLTIDVPGASEKNGEALVQYNFNNRFNQRFNIFRKQEYYVIQNLNSKLYVGVKGNSKEAGSLIVQTKMSDKLGMCWKIEYQGNNLYFIRSALYSKLLLGIKEENISIETNLVTTINEEMGLWKIIGFIPFQQN